MTLYLAMSCLQGRPQEGAYQELMKLNPDGIQLTPGNYPTSNFQQIINIPYRFHHGFSWSQYKREVYDLNGCPLYIEQNRSIHPPQQGRFNFNKWLYQAEHCLLETMYPGYLLGNETELLVAMSCGIRLAIDISHLYIQQTQGVLGKTILNKLFNYSFIEEIHLSANQGNYDTHQRLTAQTPFLEWALERFGKSNVPLIYESYLHKLTEQERLQQLELIKNIIGK